MAYTLHFFCRAGEDTGVAALDRLLDELLDNGAPLWGEWQEPCGDAVAGFSLATMDSSGMPAADLLALEIHGQSATVTL